MSGGLLSHISEGMREDIREAQAEDSDTSDSDLATSPFGPEADGEDSNQTNSDGSGGLLSFVSEGMREDIREAQAEDSGTSESALATSPFGSPGGEDSNHGDVSNGSVGGIDPRLALAVLALAAVAWGAI